MHATCAPAWRRSPPTSAVDIEFRIPPADAVPNATRIEVEDGTGVEVEVIDEAILTAIAIVPRAPRGNRGSLDFTQPEARGKRGGTVVWL